MNSLLEPNLNADVYRNMTAADRPPIPDKYLQFISIYNEKSAILGGSNLTDRYWSGTLWYYNDISDFDRDKATFATKTESGVCDAVFIDSNKLVVGEESGVLQVFNVIEGSEGSQELQCAGYACLHDSCLLTLSKFDDNKHIISGGMDCCIKIWDISELMATKSFNFAHTDIITCINSKPKSNTEFVSTSMDCEALLWDLRLEKPAQRILTKDAGLTTASWNFQGENILAIGSDNGEVIILDIRKPGAKVISESNAYPRPVHKLLFNPCSERSEELAVCCDDTPIEVLNINSQVSSIYKDNRHSDIARGLTWLNNHLYSCAWDYTVLKHTIASKD